MKSRFMMSYEIPYLAAPALESISKDEIARKRREATMPLLAKALNCLGSVILDHYAALEQVRRAFEKASLENPGLSAKAHIYGEDWHSGIGRMLGQRMANKIPQVISNPTPGMLVLGLITYGIGASTLYHLNHRDKYQDATLAAGIVIGACLGIFTNMEGQAILLRILPWAVLVALWLSEIGHRVHATRHVRPKTNEGLLL
ncbi:hypothetical protein CSPX01_04682 [Colletotrichum filicis]|nr:hypothetical protein CSPX01_04682 [Colletotrichum filicis]